MGPVTPQERNTLFAFCIALLLWMAPDLAAMASGGNEFSKWLQDHVPASIPAVVAAALLFVMPAGEGGRRALTWKEGTTIDWGTILLFGGGIALGQAMFSSGLAKNLGDLAAEASGANSLWAITALCTAAAILLSELASNTAAATTLVPVAIALAEGAGVSPIAPALGVAIGSSMGFMLPVSTAPNAIVYSSGLIPARFMIRAGIVIDILGFIVTVFCLWAFLPLAGLR